jgi:hypothetical protein
MEEERIDDIFFKSKKDRVESKERGKAGGR